MQITNVQVRKVDWGNSVAGLASVTFDESFVVRDLRVINGSNGLFVAMPSRKGGDGEYRDICHPITAEFRNELQDKVLQAFNQLEN
ncbi:MAG: septation regulator SpoVG [Halanaerobium sp.]|nr:septation regulator SpoVG [Halanaerobium sp.]